ncbi:MAG: glycosyltransferase [Promethearchaeota archaeon]
MKFLIGVCGIGLGHAGRSLRLAERLTQAGHEVFFTSFGEAQEFLQKRKSCKVYNIPPYEWYSTGLEPNWSMSALYGAPIIHRIIKGYKKILELIKKEKPDVVLSDTDFPSLLAIAKENQRVKGYYLTNTLRIGRLGRQLLENGHITSRMLTENLKCIFNQKIDTLFRYLYKKCKKVYCLDFPPPYTLAQHNMLEENPFATKLQYIGVIGGKQSHELPSKEKLMEKLELNKEHPTLYIGVSGPNKDSLLYFFEELFDERLDKNIIITTGTPSTDHVYKNKKVKVFNWYPVREELIKVADVVIARAGLGTISEILAFGKKSILIPELQPEQIENANALEQRSLCLVMDEKTLDKKNFEAQLEIILQDSKMEKQLNEYQMLCSKYNALSAITDDFN